MNVLTITQSFALGGLESRIHGDINWANKHGIGTYLATSENVVMANLPSTSLGITTGLEIGNTASCSALLHAVNQLAEIIKCHHIDIIHAHPFAALWPAFLVSQLTRTPLVVSLHGPISLSPAQQGIHWPLQMAFVLPHASLLACVSNETYDLVKNLVCHDRIGAFPNCVDTQKFYPTQRISTGCWTLISRLDEDKKPGIIAFFEMLPDLQISQLDVIGDGGCRDELEKFASSPKLKSKTIRFLGARLDIDVILDEYDGVVGMGRVVLEAMAKSLPVILLGYDGVKGGVNEALLEQAAYSNFSGRGLENISSEELKHWLESNSGLIKSEYFIKTIHEQYSEAQLWQQFYADISNLPFVECAVFDALMSILESHDSHTAPYCDDYRILHKIERLIDSQEHACLSATNHPEDVRYILHIMNMVRGWRLGMIAEEDARYRSLITRCEKEIAWHENEITLLEKEIARVKGSVSWRLTRPVRGAFWAFSRLRNLIKSK